MAFVQNYPFDFKLLNDKGEDEFYLEDKLGAVTLAITNNSGSLIEINSPSNGDCHYHFALKFRPGTLRMETVNGINIPAYGQPIESNWKISSPQKADNDGCTMLNLTYTGELLPLKNTETLNIKFNLNIDGSLGTRSTNVLLLDNVTALRKPRQINWTIINHRGKPKLPLEITFKDADTILNDGITPNSLSFRISNTNKNSTTTDPIVHFNNDERVGPVSKIFIYFDIGDNAAHKLANASEVQHITIAESVKASINTPDQRSKLSVIYPEPDEHQFVELLSFNFAYKNDFINTFGDDKGEKIWNEMVDKGWIVPEQFMFTFEDHSKDPLPSWMFKPSQDLCLLPHICADGDASNLSKSLSDYKQSITTINFTVANIKTNYITGKTRMYVRFENIPGYWDDTFIMEIDKQPLVMKGGNVGIGTNDPYFKLDIQGSNGETTGIGFNTGNKWHHMFLSHDGATAAITAGGAENGLALKVGKGDKDSYNDQSYKEAIRLLPNGNVGIGTDTPASKLHIQVNNKGLNLPLFIRNMDGSQNSDNAVGIGFINESQGDWAKAAIVHEKINSYGIGSIRFLVSNEANETPVALTDARMTIASNGNVGIGTTNPTTAKLVISGEGIEGLDLASTDVYANLRVMRNSLSRFDKDMFIGLGSGAISSLHLYSNNVETITVTRGNVGIGTNAPGHKLDVVGSIGIRNGASWDHMMLHHDGSAGYITAGGAESGMAFRVGDTNYGSYNEQFYPEIMRLLPNGRVGIGTSNPQYPLEVNGWNYGHMETGFFFMFHNINEVRRSNNTYDNAVTIKASNFMWSQGFATFSDIRIKDNVNVSEGCSDLHLINTLEITDYQYKDFVVKGNKRHKGFIAQEVEKVFPEAVSKGTDYIPDIYDVPTDLVLNETLLSITMRKSHNLTDGDKVRLITATNVFIDRLVKVADETTFIIEDWNKPAERIFVYGKQVEDFRVLDYNQVFTAGISAIQELSKQVEELTDRLQLQETTVKQLQELVQLSLINNN